MPPKKKGKKRSSSKSKGEKQPQLTLREAILAFQIEVGEKDLNAMAKEFRVLREKNRLLKERNGRLKSEQQDHIKVLLKQAKENEKEVEDTVIINEDEVEKALLGKISTMKQLNQEQEEFKNQIKEVENEIESAQQTIRGRTQYMNVGQHVHAKEIAVLRKKLLDMETSFNEVSAHLDRSLTIFKEETQQQSQSTVVRQKNAASEEAANSINKNDQQEIADHKWLKKEIRIHLRASQDLTVVVEALEKDNLEIMQELFDCKEQDLNLARRFYLACVHDESDSEEVIISHGNLKDEEQVPDDKIYDNYFRFEEDESAASPKLGPMDLQLLSVVGTRVTVHKCTSSQQMFHDANEQCNIKDRTESDVWPITERMLQTMTIK